MKQFFAPLGETGGIELNFPQSEPCVVMTESEARRLVAAIDNCWPSDVIAIIQRQPWFKEIRAGIRATRHLQPTAYIKLSDRPKDIAGVERQTDAKGRTIWFTR